MPEPLRVVGKKTARIDALERVTGRAQYTGDLQLPDMLFARVLRSPHPHARIRRIDASRALALAGVHAVLTSDNCDVVWGSGDTRNRRRLFDTRVRFVGDSVAAVAASDRHLAEQALKLIDVEYETLPFVLDPEEALKPGAVEIQPGGNLSPNNKGERKPEISTHGDIEKGFAESDRVFEDLYISKHINNAQMERRVSVAKWDGDKLTVWTPTQGISACQSDIAKDLKLPPEKVRVICQYMGGGFGNKNQNHDFELMAALLAREAGRPVKIEFTRREDWIGVHGRWPTRQHYKVGVKSDGSLQAIQLRGYSGMGPHRKSSGDIAGIELYRCENVEKQVYPTYTNMAVSANFRGPAYPQGVFGIESLMDHIANELKIDPVEFRIKNCTEKYHDEIPYTSSGLKECLQRGAEIFEWKKRWHPPGSQSGPVKTGVGVSMGAFGSGVGRSSAVLRMDSSGKLTVLVGVTDVGTGAKTVMAMLAAEAMEMDPAKVEVIWGDTDQCPYGVGESGSRTTNWTGIALLQAAEDLKKQIRDKGLPQAGAVLTAQASPTPRIEGQSRYSWAVHFVEVAVDVELGGVKITKYVAMQDSGRILNPLASTSQVCGGAIQGIGMALHEELLYDQATGIPINAGYYGARVMTHMDAPAVQVQFVETEDAYGPYGAKAVGEPPIVPAVAAVANAIFNATGRRIKELPITRDKLLGTSA